MKKHTLLLLALLIAFVAHAQDKPKGLNVGDKAPAFTAKDQDGKKVKLKSLLKEGPVVLFFYRGAWCPYCQKQVAELQDSLSLITAKGASVVAVTPSGAESVDEMDSKQNVSFHILHDKGHKIMDAYDVTFGVDKKTQERYKGYGIDFNKVNGAETGANLPVPATYIIGQDGDISFRFFDPNYTKRVTVKELLKNLPSK
ncbi:peroxiredoxin [Fulvitalea axinellae]|uniref:thioredoxin-dependent peroxiredoxin n=1 Tax=Fulvitalea axinellae TaxID=1182444 RepID=A0AAU9CG65_9BACT|nr:peroxiredoxin [Fulvitalea axinellae]